VIRRLPVYDTVIRRSFGVYPARRAEGGGSAGDGGGKESPAGDSSSTGTNSGNAAEPAPEPAVKDVPPPPPKREVDPKDHELAELKDKYLRSIAEFRNLQLQTRREVDVAQAYTIQRFATDLLDTIDSLTESLEACPPAPPLETTDPNQKEDVLVTEHRNLYEGLRMVEYILLRTLERHGLTLIATEGEVNPPFHEVVKEVEGGKDVGTIANVIKRGYTLNGKVLRPAKVAVFKAKDKPTETSESKVEELKES